MALDAVIFPAREGRRGHGHHQRHYQATSSAANGIRFKHPLILRAESRWRGLLSELYTTRLARACQFGAGVTGREEADGSTVWMLPPPTARRRYIPRRQSCSWQLKQMVVLPITFLRNGSVGMGGFDRISYGGCRVDGSADRMGGNMRSCHRLTCRTGSRASCVIPFHCARSRMRPQRSLAYSGHPKHTCTCPSAARFETPARPVVCWVSSLTIEHYPRSAIASPHWPRADPSILSEDT